MRFDKTKLLSKDGNDMIFKNIEFCEKLNNEESLQNFKINGFFMNSEDEEDYSEEDYCDSINFNDYTTNIVEYKERAYENIKHLKKAFKGVKKFEKACSLYKKDQDEKHLRVIAHQALPSITSFIWKIEEHESIINSNDLKTMKEKAFFVENFITIESKKYKKINKSK